MWWIERQGSARNVRARAEALLQRGRSYGQLLWRRYALGQRYIEKRVHDYRLVLDARDPGISRQLLCRGAREPEQRSILERELRPGATVLDLGANLGYYTVMMARLVGPAGRVYAVEPVPESFALLQRNLALNRFAGVDAENVAIADVDGEKEMFLTPQSNWCSFHPPRLRSGAPWLRKYRRRITGTARVRTRTLQTYLADKPPIDLLRMDIEGYEVEILKSVRVLPRAALARLSILFETHPEFYAGGEEMRRVLEALRRECGLSVKYLVSDYQFGSRRHAGIEPAARLFARRGYGRRHILETFQSRAIYANVRSDDAIDLICRSECVNAALLAAR